MKWVTELSRRHPLDPATYAAATVLLVGAAALASFVPAQRASAIDPAHTLRAD